MITVCSNFFAQLCGNSATNPTHFQPVCFTVPASIFIYLPLSASSPLSDTFQYQFSFFACSSSFLHFSHSFSLALCPLFATLSLSLSVTHRTLIPFDFYSLLFPFTGVCPVLCSAHGHYGGGVCHCEDGWKGAECDIPVGECEVPNCSSHGRCIEGECRCERGWKGPYCDQRKCQGRGCAGRCGLHPQSRLSLSDFARSLAPPLPLCAVLTWHKNAKIIYLPCLQFRAVFTPRRHVDTAPIRHTHTLCEGCGPG